MIKTLKLWLHNLLAVLQVSCSLGVSYLLSRFHLKLWPPTVTACFCPCSQTPLLHNCLKINTTNVLKWWYADSTAVPFQLACSNRAKCFTSLPSSLSASPLLRGTTSQSLNIKLSLALEFVIASSPSLSPRPLLASCNLHGTVQEVGLTELKAIGIKGSSVRETKCEQGFLCVIF